MFDVNLLRELCSTNGPSGAEAPVRELISSRLDSLGIRNAISPDGSIAAVIPAGAPSKGKLMLQAHTDEVGFMIRTHTDDGYLSLSPLGVRDTRFLTGRRVSVMGKDGVLSGFIGAIPVHLSKNGKKLPAYSDLYVDIGAESKTEAESLVPQGSFGCFSSNFRLFGSNNAYVSDKALSGRAACAVLLSLAEYFSTESAENLPFDLYFVFSPRGKLTLSGGAAVFSRIRPDCVISVTSCDVPADTSISSVSGVSVPLMEEKYAFDREYAQLIRDEFSRRDMLLPTKPTSAEDEKEYDLIRLTNAGARLAAVKLPVKNRDTANEIMSLTSLDSAADILAQVIPKIVL